MDQIIYTQCPVGYGLGASGGLQIKRIDAGYPLSSDLRHLGLKAYIGTTRAMAPSTLRYKRDGDDIAEVARLSPREKEYETERGLWGRPGGHFAHGLRLSTAELAAIENWPAGLLDWPGWKTQDKEPSHGEPPEPISEAWPPEPSRMPTFEAMSTRANRLGLNARSLAALLTAMAEAVRGDRCVFLIDEAARLPDWIAILTFAAPTALRPSLTFSTYHDRPEELPGFRLHGTIPSARPNRPAMAGLGIVADLMGAVVLSPEVEPAAWALTLSSWLIGGDEDAWKRVDALLSTSIDRGSIARIEAWEDACLDRVVGFEEALRSSKPPENDLGWLRLAELAGWSKTMGFADDWLRRRPASWWLENLGEAESAAARASMRVHASISPDPGWASAAAIWHARGIATERLDAIDGMLQSASDPRRGEILAAFFRGLPAESGDALLDQLEGHRLVRASARLPLEARRAVDATREGELRGPLQTLFASAFAEPEALRATLIAVEAEIKSKPEVGPAAARAFAESIQKGTPEGVRIALSWTLSVAADRATIWLSAFLRIRLAHPEYPRLLGSIWKGVPEASRPTLAVAILSAARDSNLGREPFPWAVETLLLAIPKDRRPTDPTWPAAYLRRMPSGYDLSHKLYFPATRNDELRAWIDEGRKLGALDADQVAQLDRCRGFARLLASGDARNLRSVDIPNVSEGDRGRLLGDMLRAVGLASFEGLDFCLDACKLAWKGAFQPGAVGLGALAEPIAEGLSEFVLDPTLWLDRLISILDRLGLRISGTGFEANGLAAEIVAVTTRIPHPDGADDWALRDFLVRDDDAWRALAIDASRDVGGPILAENLDGFRRWDERLKRDSRSMELLLNASPASTLALVVQSRSDERSPTLWAEELHSIGRLSWWNRPVDAADDIRDRFVREVPLAPLNPDALVALKRWLGTPGKAETARKTVEVADESDFTPIDDRPRPEPTKKSDPVDPLSPIGVARWMVIHAITVLNRPGIDAEGRWRQMVQWSVEGLPIGRLDAEDRRRLVSWLIFRADRADERDLPGIAAWLIREGLDPTEESGRWKTWSRSLDGLVDADELERARIFRVRFVEALRESLRFAVGGGARPLAGRQGIA